MAINRSTRYPGRYDAPDAAQPEGAFKNKTGPGAVDGSYLERDWANDWAAFFSSLLNGTPADGNVDTVGASQYFSALVNMFHPIGSVIATADNVNPGTRIPGTTWAAIAGGMYIASVGTYTDPNGFTATIGYGEPPSQGTFFHELTEDEMPVHTHNIESQQYGDSGGGSYVGRGSNPAGNFYESGAAGGLAGVTQSHINYPPMFALHHWQRTA